MATSSKKILVPQAKTAMDQFKFESAKEVGVDLKQGYNGELTTRQAGSIGGQMVKKMIYDYQQRQVNQEGQQMQAGQNMQEDLSQIKEANKQSTQ